MYDINSKTAFSMQLVCELFFDPGNGCDPDDYTEATIALVDYNTNATDAGCTIYEMVVSAESAGVTALLMMRTEDDQFQTPPVARLYSKLLRMLLPHSSSELRSQYYAMPFVLDQTVDDFETVDLPVLGLTNQVGQLLRDVPEVSKHGKL